MVQWQIGVVDIIFVQLYSTNSDVRFCTNTNPTHNVLEVCNGDNLQQWFQLEIRLNILLAKYSIKELVSTILIFLKIFS